MIPRLDLGILNNIIRYKFIKGSKFIYFLLFENINIFFGIQNKNEDNILYKKNIGNRFLLRFDIFCSFQN